MNAFPAAKANFQTWDSIFNGFAIQPPKVIVPKIAGTIAQAHGLVKTQLDQTQKLSVPKPGLPDILTMAFAPRLDSAV